MKAYTAELTLRLALGVSLIACLCLMAGRVLGAQFNRSPILVYSAADLFDTSSAEYLVYVDVERNLINHAETGVTSQPRDLACFVNLRVAFSRLVNPSHHLYLTDTMGGKARQASQQEGINLFPSWSPDGRQLAFVSGTGRINDKDISVMDVGGGGVAHPPRR